MEWSTLVAFLGIVGVAAYVQTVWGFALGLTIVGGVALLGLAPVPLTAAVVSILGLCQTLFALSKSHRHILWRTVALAAGAMAPAVALGVALLGHMSDSSARNVHVLLGLFIMTGAVLLMLKPQPLAYSSPPAATFLTGLVSGLVSGLFSAGGPPMVYHLYRQPYPIAAVRATLLTIIAVGTSLRILYVVVSGGMSGEILRLSLIGVPMVVIATLIGQRYVPPLSDRNMRRMAFSLLLLLGLALVAR